MSLAQEIELRNSTPSEFLSRHGDSLVVLHPSDRWLVVGKASQPQPEVISHCIAYYTQKPKQPPSTPSVDARNIAAGLHHAEAACSQAAIATKLDQLLLRTAAAGRSGVEPIAVDDPESAPQLTNCVESVDEEGVKTYRRRIVGDEVLGIWHEEPYDIVWPLSREVISGRAGRSIIQMKDDISNIWNWALNVKLGLSSSDIKKMSVVLLVSPFTHMSTVRLLVDILLTEVCFQSLVVHLESTAAMFGQGVTQACVVWLGQNSSWVTCVDDGVLAAETRITLPYGTRNVSSALLRMMRRLCKWPEQAQFDDDEHLVDEACLENLCNQILFIPADGERGVVEQQVLEVPPAEMCIWDAEERKPLMHRMHLGPIPCLAPLAYFYTPMMFKPPTSAQMSPAPSSSHNYWSFHTDTTTPAEVVLQLLTRRNQEAAMLNPNLPKPYNYMPYMPLGPFHPPHVWPPIALDAAVLSSIVSCTSRPEQKLRLFSSILLVGPGASIRGIGRCLEQRLMAALPPNAQVDMIAVLEPRTNPLSLIWHGGVLLGTLDSRDYWVKREEWRDGGIHVGGRVKSNKVDSLHTKLFWYCKAQQGA